MAYTFEELRKIFNKKFESVDITLNNYELYKVIGKIKYYVFSMDNHVAINIKIALKRPADNTDYCIICICYDNNTGARRIYINRMLPDSKYEYEEIKSKSIEQSFEYIKFLVHLYYSKAKIVFYNKQSLDEINLNCIKMLLHKEDYKHINIIIEDSGKFNGTKFIMISLHMDYQNMTNKPKFDLEIIRDDNDFTIYDDIGFRKLIEKINILFDK